MSVFQLDAADFHAEEIKKLEAALSPLCESDCPVAAEISLVDEETIRSLNRSFRNTDKVTDVLSFPSLENIKGKFLSLHEHPAEKTEDDALFLGSVAICTVRAREQASEYGHSFERELFYLAVHGILHCLGYDHETDAERKEMRAREEEVMDALSLKRDA